MAVGREETRAESVARRSGMRENILMVLAVSFLLTKEIISATGLEICQVST